MTKIKKIVALILSVCVVLTVGVFTASAATVENDDNSTAASGGITVHYYCEDCYPKSRRDTPTEPPLSSKQVKNLLRGAKKNLR